MAKNVPSICNVGLVVFIVLARHEIILLERRCCVLGMRATTVAFLDQGQKSALHSDRVNPVAPQAANPSSLARQALCRSIPEVGAVCGKAASTDLCGGRSAI